MPDSKKPFPPRGTFDVRGFWEGKILDWEGGRYGVDDRPRGLLERLADRASDSLRFRLESTAELLAPFVGGRRVVDLGCGSGLLAPKLLAAGAAGYLGYDIADSAIALARTRADFEGWSARARFERASLADLAALDGDLIVSLGLTDWLDDAELERLFELGGEAEFLHAYSEARPSVQRWLHQAYCYVAYGYRTQGYVPRYLDTQAFAAMVRRHRKGPVYVWRHPRLTFGAYLTSLPLKGAVAVPETA